MDNYTNLWTRQASIKLETVLHDGCVDGTLTKDVILPYLKDHVKEVLGIDKWKYIIDLAKEINADDKIEYQLYDVMTRNVTDMESRFDHILSFFVAEVAVPNKLLLSKYHKMLKPSGQIFMLIILNAATEKSIYIQAEDKKWAPYLNPSKILENYTSNPVDYFQNLLGETGFKPEICEVVATPLILENFSDMMKLVWPMYGNFWGCIPNKLKEDFLKDNLKICLEMMTYLCKPDKYRMSMDSLICVASKV